MLRSVFIFIFVLLIFQQGCSDVKKEDNNKSSNKGYYLFSYFKGNGEDGLHLAYSYDGLNWQSLNNDNSFIKPEVGKHKLMRDPSIVLSPEGIFHMVWTTSWEDNVIGYASSKDLIHWSEQKTIPVMVHEPDTKNCWAPELFYDEVNNKYLIFWSTTIPGRFPETDNSGKEGRNHRIYHTTTGDFKTFTAAKLFYEPGFNCIDAAIVKSGEKYVMFIKDETLNPVPQKNIRTAVAQKADGPYGAASKPITGDYWAEGPTAIKIGDTWFVYFDKYREDRFGVIKSKDLEFWEDISSQLIFPPDARHGTVFEVSNEILETLLELK